ncbi:hypothetical protein RX411_00325 [Faecalibacterium prausnitzii]|nr:hypothetical protein [Faecalibacterium prausnitzii]
MIREKSAMPKRMAFFFCPAFIRAFDPLHCPPSLANPAGLWYAESGK